MSQQPNTKSKSSNLEIKLSCVIKQAGEDEALVDIEQINTIPMALSKALEDRLPHLVEATFVSFIEIGNACLREELDKRNEKPEDEELGFTEDSPTADDDGVSDLELPDEQ